MIVSANGDGDFELAPAGNHVARCYAVINLGMVEQGGKYPGIYHKARLSFELCSEHMKDGRPFSVSEHLTASLSSKSRLHQRLVGWRGKGFTADELEGFNLKNVLGAPCMLNVVHTPSADGQKTYVNIAGISPVPKGLEVPELVNDQLYFDFDRSIEDLPEFLRKMIGDKPGAPQPAAPVDDDYEDDIPF